MPPRSPHRQNARGWVVAVMGLGATGVAVAGITGALGYTGGWLSSERPAEGRAIAAVRAANHPGSPRGESDDVCVTGWFKSAGQAVSRTATPGRIPLVGRVALAGGMAFRTDAPETLHSTSPRFSTAASTRQFDLAAGPTIAGRWPVVPVQPFVPAGPAVEAEPNMLFGNVLNPAAKPIPQTAGASPSDVGLRGARSATYARLFSLPPQPHDDQAPNTFGPESASHDKGRS